MIICSACLAGMACKYNGKNDNQDARIKALVDQGQAIPLCPEMLGGLAVPRIPCEIQGVEVVNKRGEKQTAAFIYGASRALNLTLALNIQTAVLMPRSPSCGIGQIYDGSFSKHLIAGDGIFTRLLKAHGIAVYQPEEYFKEITDQ